MMKPDSNEMTFRKITFSAALGLRYLTSKLIEFSLGSSAVRRCTNGVDRFSMLNYR